MAMPYVVTHLHHINLQWIYGIGLALWESNMQSSLQNSSLDGLYLPKYFNCFCTEHLQAKSNYWKSHKTSQIVWCKCFLLQGCWNRGLFTELPSWKHWDFVEGDDFNCSLFCWYLMGTILLATSNCKSSFLSEASLRITPERQLEIRIQKTDAKNMSA